MTISHEIVSLFQYIPRAVKPACMGNNYRALSICRILLKSVAGDQSYLKCQGRFL